MEKDCDEIQEAGQEISCPQCNYEVDVHKLDSLRCPRCFAILFTKCEDCQKCK